MMERHSQGQQVSYTGKWRQAGMEGPSERARYGRASGAEGWAMGNRGGVGVEMRVLGQTE